MDIEIVAENILWRKQHPEEWAREQAIWDAYDEAVKTEDWKTAHDILKRQIDKVRELK